LIQNEDANDQSDYSDRIASDFAKASGEYQQQENDNPD
jgi:hypothetical protein